MAQNPNSNGARHPIDITSPWNFLSADPDTTFTLQKREYKVNQRVIDAEPQVRPLWFNKCSGKTTAALAISDEEMSDDAEELWEKKMVVKMNTSEDPVVRSRSIKRTETHVLGRKEERGEYDGGVFNDQPDVRARFIGTTTDTEKHVYSSGARLGRLHTQREGSDTYDGFLWSLRTGQLLIRGCGLKVVCKLFIVGKWLANSCKIGNAGIFSA